MRTLLAIVFSRVQVWAVLLALLASAYLANGGELEDARARARHEIDQSFVSSDVPDYNAGLARAIEEGKQIVLWVNVSTADHAQLRKNLDKDAVHIALTSWSRDATPRIIYKGGDGQVYYKPEHKLTPEYADVVRIKWALQDNRVPGARARVVEEARLSFPVQPAFHGRSSSSC